MMHSRHPGDDGPASRSDFTAIEKRSARFYDRWMTGRGLFGAIGRKIFSLSGVKYGTAFIKAANLTSRDRLLEIGCGSATILIEAHRLLQPRVSYLGLDVSREMINQARENVA